MKAALPRCLQRRAARGCLRGRDGETVGDRTKKLTFEFAARARPRASKAGTCIRRWCDRSIQYARQSYARNGSQCRVIAWNARRGYQLGGVDTGAETVHMGASDPYHSSPNPLASRGPSTYASAAKQSRASWAPRSRLPRRFAPRNDREAPSPDCPDLSQANS